MWRINIKIVKLLFLIALGFFVDRCLGISNVSKQPTSALNAGNKAIGPGFVRERTEQIQQTPTRHLPSRDSLADFYEELHSPFRQGKLKENIQFWRETIQSSKFVLDIIENDYKIPFKETPLPCKFDNRSSAIRNKSFVEEEIKKVLERGCIEGLDKPTPFCNPLHVSEQQSAHIFRHRLPFSRSTLHL